MFVYSSIVLVAVTCIALRCAQPAPSRVLTPALVPTHPTRPSHAMNLESRCLVGYVFTRGRTGT